MSNLKHIFVVGNEKGGAGKTTCSMHLIAGLLDKNYRVTAIDVDTRQHSLTTYLNNRANYNKANPNSQVVMPLYFHIQESSNINDTIEQQQQLQQQFETALTNGQDSDYVVIDTPGSHSFLSRIAHSYADTVVTPINDSFVDLDVIARITNNDIKTAAPSIYSQMLWEQKMERAARDGGSINWVVVRNRLSNLDAKNKRKMLSALQHISSRIAFKLIPGFSERVIFRELFPFGLTLLDLKKTNFIKNLSTSHVAARQELREFLTDLGIK